jgi:endonuclease YncB( thermonuclease family)
MVRAGMAWWYREYAKEQTPDEQGAYQGAEDAARVTKRGLWKDAKPVPPWEWRNKGRAGQAQESRPSDM